MKKLLLLLLATGLVSILIFMGCAAPATTQPPAPASTQSPTPASAPLKAIEWKMAEYYPIGDHITDASMEFAKLVETRTNGRLKITVYPSEQLMNIKDFMPAIEEGRVDMVEMVMPRATQIEPVLAFTTLPFVLSGTESFAKALDAGLRKPLEQIALKHKAIPLWYGSLTSNLLSSRTKEIKVPEDLRGQRMNMSEYWAPFAQKYGVSIQSITSAEAYAALQRGIVDGREGGTVPFVVQKLYEVQKYATVGKIGLPTSWWLVNKDRYDALPSDIQKVILTTAHEVEDKDFKRAVDEEDKAIDFIKKRPDMVVHMMTPEERALWKQETKIIWDSFIEKRGEQAKTLIDICLKAQ